MHPNANEPDFDQMPAIAASSTDFETGGVGHGEHCKTVVEKVSGETREVSTSDPIFLDEASTITLQVDPNDVATITRGGVDGQDLIVVLDDGTQIVIQNYFAANSGGELSELVLVDEQGGSWWLRADPETGGFLLVGDTTIPVASAVVASSADAAAFSPILGIGLGAGALALGLASMGGGSSGSPSTPLPPSPPPPADVTPPPPPTAVINATGDTVSNHCHSVPGLWPLQSLAAARLRTVLRYHRRPSLHPQVARGNAGRACDMSTTTAQR